MLDVSSLMLQRMYFVLCSYNLRTSMKVVQSCTIQGDTFMIAPQGQLFAEVALNDELNEDTDAGQELFTCIGSQFRLDTTSSGAAMGRFAFQHHPCARLMRIFWAHPICT